MPFEGLDPHEKPESLETLQRFMEIEIHQATKTMSKLHSEQHTLTSILRHVAPLQVSKAPDILTNSRFRYQGQNEMVRYFRYNLYPYKRIKELTGVNSHRISRMRFDYSVILPEFDFWSRESLKKWNELRHLFNLWDENLLKRDLEEETPEPSFDYKPKNEDQTYDNPFDFL